MRVIAKKEFDILLDNFNTLNRENQLNKKEKESYKQLYRNYVKYSLNEQLQRKINNKKLNKVTNGDIIKISLTINHNINNQITKYYHNDEPYSKFNLKNVPVINKNKQIINFIKYVKPSRTQEFCETLNKIQLFWNVEIIKFIRREHRCYQYCRDHKTIWDIFVKHSNCYKKFIMEDNPDDIFIIVTPSVDKIYFEHIELGYNSQF